MIVHVNKSFQLPSCQEAERLATQVANVNDWPRTLRLCGFQHFTHLTLTEVKLPVRAVNKLLVRMGIGIPGCLKKLQEADPVHRITNASQTTKLREHFT